MYDLNQQLRFMLVELEPMGTNTETILKNLEEVELLVKTYGGRVYAATAQKSHYRNRSKSLGAGKAEEVADAIAKEKIDIVVINDLVSPGQLYSLEKIFCRANQKIKVWDRMDLILNIFALHAHTKEAKLQIDLARLRHMGPRTFGMGYILSRQGGGIGTVGVGETNTELMKRHWRNEMRRISEELERLLVERKKQIEKRKNIGFLTVSLVGYTNSGKTTLFNLLTKKENYVSDNLFATLDSAVGKIEMAGKHRDIVVSDTIGFIKNLPPSLIETFKSTLMESINADLLLIVVDVSDSEFADKLLVVDGILNELKLEDKKRIYVFNKADKLDSSYRMDLEKQYFQISPLFISAKSGDGIDVLFNRIGQTFNSK
ncbi:GTPase HflX [Candidatus Gottesmanbacteria bacterium]|nr:GTPase HflX [Candidatus Gottesmanbacteria bacterium]